MISHDDRLGCKKCRKVWKLSPYGRLYDSEKNIYSIVDWYNNERTSAENELCDQLKDNSLIKSFNVRIEALPNEYGFVKLGDGHLTFNSDSFILEFRPKKKYNYTPIDWEFGKDNSVTIRFPHKTRDSLQTEYNYRGRGPAIVLSSPDMCYYLYSDDKDFNPTELQFMAEYLSSQKL